MAVEGIDPYSPVVPAQPAPPPVETNPPPEETEAVQEEGTGENIDTSA